MLAASDTFRAAAIEQLENWANKVDVQITKSSQGSDPASVAYKAIEESIKNKSDQVLIDTAGRLQNKKILCRFNASSKKIWTWKEVVWLIENEWAETSEDILWRRSKIGLRLDEDQVKRLDAYLIILNKNKNN